MSTIPEDLKYTREHEWVRIDGTQATIGVTDHAQRQLGDVVFVELPKVGDNFDWGASVGTIESVKAVAEIYAPITGKIIEVNESLNDDPELVNEEPYGEGWLVRLQVTNSSELEQLLSAAQYEEFIREEAS